MYKICLTPQSAQRQYEIEQALLNMMLKRPYEDITVSELCDSIHLPRKAFYRYFSDKDGALYALIDHTMEKFFDCDPEKVQKKGTALTDLELTFVFWKNHKIVLDAIDRNKLGGVFAQRAGDFAIRERHIPQQLMRLQPVAQEMAMSFYIYGLMAMILQWHRQGFLLSPKEMTQLTMGLLSKSEE